MNEIEKNLIETIDLMIHERFKKLSTFNYYIEAVIETDNGDGTYNIEYNGQILNDIKSREGLSLVVGDVVLVCIVNGNFSNKFIDLKRP